MSTLPGFKLYTCGCLRQTVGLHFITFSKLFILDQKALQITFFWYFQCRKLSAHCVCKLNIEVYLPLMCFKQEWVSTIILQQAVSNAAIQHLKFTVHFFLSFMEQYLMINYVKIQSYIDVITSLHNRWPCLPSMHLFERVKADNKNPQRSSLDNRLHYLKACYVRRF